MNIRQRAIHLVLIWMKAGRREGGGVREGGDSLKVEESVQKRDRGFLLSSGKVWRKKKTQKDR